MTQDLMNRWTYPLVPDMFAPSHDELYQYKRSNIYLQPGCILGRRCKLLGSVVLGPGCVVGEGDGAETTLRGTVLGRNCTVGCGVRLRNAYVLDGSTIGNNCSVDHALIGRNVKICDGVVIPHGCVIDDGVEIGPNITLPKHIRVSLTRSEPLHNEPEPLEIFADEALVFRPRDLTALPEVTEDEEEETDDVEDAEEELFDGDLEAEPESGTGMEDTLAPDESDQADEDNAGDGEEEEDEEEAGEGSTEDTEQQEESEQYDVEFVGEAGRGFRFILRPDFEDSVEAMYWKEPKRAPPPPAVFPSALTRAMSLSSELPESPEDEDVDSLLGDADVVEPLIDLDQEFEEFYSDVLELIQQRVKPDNVKGAPFSAIQVEITGSRAAHNMDHSDVCCAIVRAIITSADRVPRAKCERYLAQLTAAMSPFLQNYVETDMDQHVCIENLMEFCLDNDKARPCFQTLLYTLYDKEVLDEDAILQWFRGYHPGEGAERPQAHIYEQARRFVKWLEEAEEEDDDDVDDDENDAEEALAASKSRHRGDDDGDDEDSQEHSVSGGCEEE
ncbi:hypothetical protein PTSG_12074 [Salpingoeca rosetta]|uniref:W2 domain-containing protein n=1 Tax=Salpingoeca rosetta (strain ATCC 50818 / BSB-021) TaxID=946362 RepID=F2U6H1_SALR5|nr:uncharacterized protein PTSG_12074 [Salpingoeca rosetta]EGD83112.1 hypothetical protein PTSG_12074 [Salpingoeca rosetta]|eukprot:XP_004995476.1 hypothetical protein PTSG_12074 [Salpingoeca rosetta]